MPVRPARFHLMIGAAASGKSTAARILTRAIQAPDQPPVRYISSSAIRRDLYGDSGFLGSWKEVEAVIQQELCEALVAGETVILEASYTKRAFRLAITQAMVLPQPVQWVGWWLDTPQHLCLQWNRQRDRPVPDDVILRQCAQLLQSAPVPHRQEGFCQVVRLQSGQERSLDSLIVAALAGMESSIQRGTNRDASHELHGYSRLLDQERLLYLVQLLCQQPKLTVTGCPPDPELDLLLSPLPPGGLPEKAAAILGRLHGACYADTTAVARDLDWLESQGFTAQDNQEKRNSQGASFTAIEPPAWPDGKSRPLGGLPRLADREAFCQTFTVLRYLLHHPYDQAEGERITEHLAECLNRENGGQRHWRARQVHTAITATLTPYGFRLPGRSGRRGFALGTALLSLQQLQEACRLLQLQAEELGDRSAAAISDSLRQRLCEIGADPDRHPPGRRWLQPHRPRQFAPQSGGRSDRDGECVIATAIHLRQKLLIAQSEGRRTPTGAQAVWPLQLLLQGSCWWLLHEHASIGLREGLLACTPLDEVHVFQVEQRSSREQIIHLQALERAMVLQQLCGGLCFGLDLAQQQELVRATAEGRILLLSTLRLRCAPAVMKAIRRELDRFLPAAIRLSAPLPGDSWGGTPPRRYSLQVDGDPLHPYPVEVDLPGWVLDGDGELRRWLLSYGSAIRIESPQSLVAEHRDGLRQALALYDATVEASASGENPPEASPAATALNAAGGVRRRNYRSDKSLAQPYRTLP